MDMHILIMLAAGFGVGVFASFAGLGGGLLMVPLLLYTGFSAQKAVGTSFLAILIISISAIFAHSRLGNVDWKTGLILGVGGLIGAQLGAYLVEHVPTPYFRKIFALFISGIAFYLFFKK